LDLSPDTAAGGVVGYDLALQLGIAVCLWIVIDLVGARGPRAARAPVGFLAGGALLWILGERLTYLGTTDAHVLLGRRILFLGSSLVPVAWLWTGAVASGVTLRPLRLGRRDSGAAPESPRGDVPWLLVALVVPLLVLYSALWWDPGGRFVHPTQRPPVHGPWFWPYTALAWVTVLAGTALMLRAAWRRRRRPGASAARDWRVFAIAASALLPLGVNALHLLVWRLPFDPTPAALGVAGILVRYAVIESGIAGFVPIGRRDLLDQISKGVLVADATDRVIYANPSARVLVAPDEPVGAALDDMVARAEADPARCIEVTRVPVHGRAGRAGSAALLVDRTEHARLERRLAEAHQLESVAILASGVAHEINNPLAVVVGNLTLAEDFAKDCNEAAERGELPPSLRGEAGELEASLADASYGAARIQRIVQRLTALVRPASSDEPPQPLDFAHVVRRAHALVGGAAHADTIVLRLAPVAPVIGREAELVQICVHLLLNALQASEDAPEIEVELGMRGRRVCLEVRDRGEGLSDEALTHLFDPFFTTRRPLGGPGLGLSLGLALARRHGGWIEAENRLGGGALLRLWLPAAPDDAQPPLDSSSASAPGGVGSSSASR